MYSTRCQHCKQLLNFKTEEVRAMVNEAQEARQKHYEIRCPQCGKYMKLQVSELKRRLPPPETALPAPAEASEVPAPAPAEQTETPAPPAEAAPKKKRSKASG
jgi:RNase P subunit RPR2